MTRKRVLSGMRPTGRLHMGHLFGALDNWRKLQETYDCFFFIADWHALTTDYADSSKVKEYTTEVVLDWLAAGLDPKKATFFVQSEVAEHAELHLLFSMFTPLAWLERVPTYKEQREQITDKDLSTYGFLGYPLLQAADILIYKAHYVPVGVDQVPHVERVERGVEAVVRPQRVARRQPRLEPVRGGVDQAAPAQVRQQAAKPRGAHGVTPPVAGTSWLAGGTDRGLMPPMLS